MRVYRVEDTNGIGPYSERHKLVEHQELLDALNSHCLDNGHPGACYLDEPFGNGGPTDYYNYRFGFSDMEQLNNWFSPQEQELLNDAGFVISVYEGKEVLMGRHQVAFKRGLSKLIERVKLR